MKLTRYSGRHLLVCFRNDLCIPDQVVDAARTRLTVTAIPAIQSIVSDKDLEVLREYGQTVKLQGVQHRLLGGYLKNLDFCDQPNKEIEVETICPRGVSRMLRHFPVYDHPGQGGGLFDWATTTTVALQRYRAVCTDPAILSAAQALYVALEAHAEKRRETISAFSTFLKQQPGIEEIEAIYPNARKVLADYSAHSIEEDIPDKPEALTNLRFNP